MLETERAVFFYSNQDPFSNFFKVRFALNGLHFDSSEQCFMYQKAQLFGDAEAAACLAAETRPTKAKALGRAVKGFTEATWQEHRLQLMFAANLAKFSQDERLAAALLATGDKVLIEASPWDRIWGIGVAATDPAAADPARWPAGAQNLLGIVLEQVRGALRAPQPQPGSGACSVLEWEAVVADWRARLAERLGARRGAAPQPTAAAAWVAVPYAHSLNTCLACVAAVAGQRPAGRPNGRYAPWVYDDAAGGRATPFAD